MSCERRREALKDLAAGAAAAAGLEEHLAGCGGCRKELAALRSALALADQALHELAAAEPSPRLRARIAEAAADAPPRGGWAPLAWGLWPVAAAAVVVLAVWAAQVIGRGGALDPVPAATLASRPHPAPEPDRGGRPDPRQPQATPRAVLADASERRARPHGEEAGSAPTGAEPGSSRTAGGLRRAAAPDIVVPLNQARALARFAREVDRVPVPPGSLILADLEAPLRAPADLEIAPIEVPPLAAEPEAGL